MLVRVDADLLISRTSDVATGWILKRSRACLHARHSLSDQRALDPSPALTCRFASFGVER
jgi:hypothetical protein